MKEIQRVTGDKKWLRFDYERKHCFRRRSALAAKHNSAGEMGHRIAKHVYNNAGTTLERSTYYILDAQGNQISTYDYEVAGGNAQYNLKERHIFGSSRLGMRNDSLNMLTATVNPYKYTRTIGWKYYEFSNHLGNVLTVFADMKAPVDNDANGVVDAYRVPIRNTADYSPFGVQLDGRTIQGDFYRRGFNGMEKDDEVKGGGNSYDFGARMYDSRVGRWLSRDAHEAKYPNLNPYNFVSNNPIVYIDPDGKDIIIAFVWEYKGNPKISQLKYSNGKLYTLDGKKWNGNGIGKTFFNKVLKDLNDLKAIDSETNKVVEYLENEKTEVHYISNRENLVAGKKDGEEYDGTQIASSNRAVEDDDKSERPGSWTTYNAFNWKQEYSDSQGADNDKNDKFRNPICALGHELFHAFDRSKRTMDYTSYEIDGKFLHKREIAAVNFENIIRSKINETKRTKYGTITIPKSLLK